jgi:hypothetical protein
MQPKVTSNMIAYLRWLLLYLQVARFVEVEEAHHRHADTKDSHVTSRRCDSDERSSGQSSAARGAPLCISLAELQLRLTLSRLGADIGFKSLERNAADTCKRLLSLLAFLHNCFEYV